jgi:hypothetical protein
LKKAIGFSVDVGEGVWRGPMPFSRGLLLDLCGARKNIFVKLWEILLDFAFPQGNKRVSLLLESRVFFLHWKGNKSIGSFFAGVKGSNNKVGFLVVSWWFLGCPMA